MKSRILILFLLCFVGWATVVLKAAHLQILPNDKLKALQQRQFRKIVTLPSRRGAILDRNQQELAVTVPSHSLFADPKLIERPRETSRRLARHFNLPYKAVYDRLKDKNKRFVWLKRHLDEKQREIVSAWHIRGLGFIEEPKRIYPNGSLLSNVIGFVGVEGGGLEGVELRYDPHLRGDPRQLNVRRDARGRPLVVNGKLFADNPDGASLMLTIDRELQFKLENELRRAVETHEADGATGVVLDARTAEILAMANVPDYDLNKPADYVEAVRRNRAVTDAFEPGSTLKTILIAGALKGGYVKPNTRIDCENGQYRLGKRVIREADTQHRFGLLTVSEILAFSSNIGTTKMALQMGDQKVRATFAEFGFGERSGVDLPGEADGILHTAPWRPHLLANVSFGHGMTATPLQIAAAYAAIASDGVLRKPFLVKAVFHPDTEERQEFKPQDRRRVLSAEDAATLRLMLAGATAPNATGFKARIPGFPVAGKTGTAQKVSAEKRGYLPNAYISSFAGFVPANDPRYVIYVAVDNPRNKFYGSEVAAPVFSQVAGFAVRKAGLPPILISDKDIMVDPNAESNRLRKKALEDIRQQVAVQDHKIAPDLTGLSLREAIQRIQGQRIRIQATGSGLVSRSWPAPGEPLPRNRVLRVQLSEAVDREAL